MYMLRLAVAFAGLLAALGLTGCGYGFKVYEYPEPIMRGRYLLEQMQAHNKASAAGQKYERPESLTPVEFKFLYEGTVNGATEVAIRETPWHAIPVYWCRNEEDGLPPSANGTRDFSIIGAVHGGVGFLWQGGNFVLVEIGFRRAAHAMGGDAVVYAQRTFFLGTYPGNEFRGYVIRWER